MSSIDERVVAMKFENSQFQAGVKASLEAFEKLKTGLNVDGLKKGLSDASNAAKNFSLSSIADNVEQVSGRFSNLGIVGMTVISNLTTKAMSLGQAMVGKVLGPLIEGGKQRALNMEQAKFQFKGLKMDVEKAMKSASDAVDGTAYGLDAAAKVAAQFGAAGMKAGDKMTQALTGISGAAAMTGRSYEEIGSIFTTVAGNGKLTTQQLNQFATRGLNAAAALAKVMGKSEAEVRAMTTKGKISFEMFAGAMNKAFGAHAKKANDTYTGSLANMRAAVSRIGADFQIPKMEAMRKIFNATTPVINSLRKAIGPLVKLYTSITNQSAKAYTSMMKGVDLEKSLGPMFKQISKIIANVYNAIKNILKPIKDAFKETFDFNLSGGMTAVLKWLADLTSKFVMGKDSAEKLKTTFKGLFSIFNIAFQIVGQVVSVVANLFGLMTLGSTEVLGFGNVILTLTSTVGKWLIAADEAVKKATWFRDIFGTLGKIIEVVIGAVRSFIVAVVALVKEGPDAFIKAFSQEFAKLAPVLNFITEKFHTLIEWVLKVADAFKTWAISTGKAAWEPVVKAVDNIVAAFEIAKTKIEQLRATKFSVENIKKTFEEGMNEIRQRVSDGWNGVNTAMVVGADGVKDGLSTAGEQMNAFGKAASNAWQSVQNGMRKAAEVTGPVLRAIADFFATVSNKITDYIRNLDFQDAVALFNAGIIMALVLSLRRGIKQIDKVADMFVEALDALLNSASKIIDAITGVFGQMTDTLKSMQQSLQATTLLKIAAAVVGLTIAAVMLSKIDIAALGKALGAITIMLGQLLGAMKIFTMIDLKNLKGITSTATALALLGIAILLLATAVKKLADLDWEGLAKGLIGVGGLLAALALFTKFSAVDEKAAKQGVGLILLAVAIRILASSVEKFGKMDIPTLIQGITTMGVVMAALTVMTRMINGTSGFPQAATGMLILSVAMIALSGALKIYAMMDWSTTLKGISAISLAVIFVGTAMRALKGSLKGAAALVVVSGALVVLSGVLKILGAMDGGEIANSLIALGGALLILNLAMIGMQSGLAGAGALMVMAAALYTLLPVIVALGMMDLTTILTALGALAGVFLILGGAALILTPVIPMLLALGVAVTLLGTGLMLTGAGFMAFAVGFATFATVGTAGIAVMTAAITAIMGLIPLFMEQLALGIRAGAKVIGDSAPVFIVALTKLIMALLTALENAIPKAVQVMVTLILALLKAIEVLVPRFIQVIGVIIMAMVYEIERLVPQIAAAGVRMIVSFLDEIGKGAVDIVDKAVEIIENFLQAIANAVPRIVEAGMKMVIDILNGVTRAVNENSDAMANAGLDLAEAIISGMVRGIGNGLGRIKDAAMNIARNALDAAKSFLGIASPSKEFTKIGKYVNEGFLKGLKSGKRNEVIDSFNYIKSEIKNAMKVTRDEIAKTQKKLKELEAKRKKDQAAAKTGRTTSARNKAAEAVKKDNAAIAEAKKKLSELTAENKKLSSVSTALSKNLNTEKNRLAALAKQYESVKDKLVAAKEALEDAKKTRDDYNKSVKDQYSSLPDINNETVLSDYIKDMKNQIADTKRFTTVMGNLRNLGLSDMMYKELISKGVDAMPFAEELMMGGKSKVNEINSLGKQLESSAATLGNNASKALYQAAVDSAAGLVKGLQNQEAAIKKQMDKIADSMVSSIKKKLGIKSPSREFMKVGRFSNEGLAAGLDQYSKIAEKSAENVGHDTINALRKTISGLSEVIDGEMDMNPVITPVLDLSDIQNGSRKLASMLESAPIGVEKAYARAANTSAAFRQNQATLESTTAGTPASVLNFTQNNNSPKALSEAEIYRQTKNQLSVVKGALK